jgi:transketolase
MRKAFVEALCELGSRDARVMLLTADLGWSVLEPFAERFPDRFINVGVAEQNMLGIATGLARQGHVPFVYSIATFASMRCYEQFRNGPVLHDLPVRVVGTGGGFAYGHAGPTHHAIEDYAIARALPGVTVIAPADSAQARSVIDATATLPGAVYLRIDKTEQADIPELHGRFDFDRPIVLRTGRELLLLSTGSIAREALEAADHMSSGSSSPGVAVMAHLGFEPNQALAGLLRQYSEVVTLEEASVVGGLGSLVAETIADFGLSCRLLRLGVRVPLQGHYGGRPYLLNQHGIDAVSVVSQTAQFSNRRLAA